jgi:hypothetical protein
MRLFILITLRSIWTYPHNSYMRVADKSYRQFYRSNGFTGEVHVSELPDINLPKRSWLGTPSRSLSRVGEQKKDRE